MSIQRPVCSDPDKITRCYEKVNYECPDVAYCPWECQVKECQAGCMDGEGNIDTACRDLCQMEAWMPVCLQIVCSMGCTACVDSDCTSTCSSRCSSSCNEQCKLLQDGANHSDEWLAICQSYCL